MLDLNSSELSLLGVAIDCIIPPDEAPSASEAGVLEFLVQLIRDEGYVPAYKAGLERLRAASFETLSFEGRLELLRRPELQDFVDLLATQVNEGYYTSAAGLADVGFTVTA